MGISSRASPQSSPAIMSHVLGSKHHQQCMETSPASFGSVVHSMVVLWVGGGSATEACAEPAAQLARGLQGLQVGYTLAGFRPVSKLPKPVKNRPKPVWGVSGFPRSRSEASSVRCGLPWIQPGACHLQRAPHVPSPPLLVCHFFMLSSL